MRVWFKIRCILKPMRLKKMCHMGGFKDEMGDLFLPTLRTRWLVRRFFLYRWVQDWAVPKYHRFTATPTMFQNSRPRIGETGACWGCIAARVEAGWKTDAGTNPVESSAMCCSDNYWSMRKSSSRRFGVWDYDIMIWIQTVGTIRLLSPYHTSSNIK